MSYKRLIHFVVMATMTLILLTLPGKVETAVSAGAHRPAQRAPVLLPCAVRLNDTAQADIASALAAAQDNDTIKVSGDCAEHDLLITRTLTLEGGWNADFTIHDPATYTTTIDAQTLGRVLAIIGPEGATIASSVSDLTLKNGRAANATPDPGWGGCVYAVNATPTITGNTITGCLAQTGAADGYGGGIFVDSAGAATLIEGNTISHNFALDADGNSAVIGWGGGLLLFGDGTIRNNQFVSNHAGAGYLNNGRGGGFHVAGGQATISGNHVEGNYASQTRNGYGGGVALTALEAGSAVFDNVIANNVASANTDYVLRGYGGGVYQLHGEIVWQDNQIINNTTAEMEGGGAGGGVYLENATAVFTGTNIIQGNGVGYSGDGGGLWATDSVLTIAAADIRENYAGGSSPNQGQGGGLFINLTQFTLRDSTIEDNGIYAGLAEGGGIYVYGGTAIIERNLIRSNELRNSIYGGDHKGGGIMLIGSVSATLNANLILGNRVSEQAGNGYGGGVYVNSTLPVTLTNNIIADNFARLGGAGVYSLSAVTMIHNTVADNDVPAGQTVASLEAGGGTLVMTNTIVAGQEMGIAATGGGSVAPDHTLFWGNTADGTRGTNSIDGNPQFVAPAGGDYHIGSGSAARESGILAGVSADLDGELRDSSPDIGADEYIETEPAGMEIYLPLVRR